MTDPLETQKRELRSILLRDLAAVAPDDLAHLGASIRRHVPGLWPEPDAGPILLYASGLPGEVATAPLLHAAWARGHVVLLPRVHRSPRRLSLHRVDDPGRDLVPGYAGLSEPHPSIPEADPGSVRWALVPGLAFDPLGRRLGRGAGHYDRLLPTLAVDCPRWALALPIQWVEEVPAGALDAPVDGVVLPDGPVVTSPSSTTPRPA